MGYLINATSSGIYLPNVLSEIGGCSGSSFTNAYFMQIGNFVNVSIYGNTTVDFSTNSTNEIQFDFPINAITPNAIGTVSIDKPLLIQGYVLNNSIYFTCNNILIVGQSLLFTVTLQYSLI